MSFLWSGTTLLLSTIHQKKKPSPTDPYVLPDSAQSPDPSRSGGLVRLCGKPRFIEGTSLPALLLGKAEASMTVEAAVVLPLFLFFLLHLGCAIELIRLHGNLQLALWEICGKTAVYGYALEDQSFAPFFSGLYVREQLVETAGKEYLDQAPLQNGSAGLSLWESDLFSSRDEMDVTVTYAVSPWISSVSFLPFRMANRFCVHIWNGYEIPENPEADHVCEDVVYMTENGEVYHENPECTYLRLRIRQVTGQEAQSAVNLFGERYTPCERCRPDPSAGTLYLTEEGERYHASADCPGLKRTVLTVPRKRGETYPPCSRCAKEGGAG